MVTRRLPGHVSGIGYVYDFRRDVGKYAQDKGIVGYYSYQLKKDLTG
jgi:hypothetical protein